MIRLARFLRAYRLGAAARVREEEVEIEVCGRGAPALLFHPGGRRPAPGWVVLHGITVPGMRHPALLRFARAIAGSGAAVVVPEIESWTRLRVDPAAADSAVAGAARFLASRPEVREGGVGIVGFSFGATQALVTAASPEIRPRVRKVVGFGGYCDLRRTLGFMLTGEHEWGGVTRRLEPDPYGRWIVAANYLAEARGYEGMEAVAAAARELAAEAGRRGIYAGDPAYDPRKEELRRALGPGERRVWDLIGAPVGARPDREAAAALADALVEAALRVHPALDPIPALASLAARPVLAHGHGDHLIPFTETLRLAAHLPPSTRPVIRITRLFSHSGGADGVPRSRYPVELWRYATLLHAALQP